VYAPNLHCSVFSGCYKYSCNPDIPVNSFGGNLLLTALDVTLSTKFEELIYSFAGFRNTYAYDDSDYSFFLDNGIHIYLQKTRVIQGH